MVKKKKTPTDRVGHRVPTEKEVEHLLANIRDAKTFASALGPVLSPSERARVTRPRLGNEPTADLILRLAQEHNVSSRVWSIDGARRDEAVFKAIQAATQEAFVLWKTLRDIHMQARGEHWDATLFYYGALSQIAESDADLALSLEPATEFFALGPQDADKNNAPSKPAEDDPENDTNDNSDGLT